MLAFWTITHLTIHDVTANGNISLQIGQRQWNCRQCIHRVSSTTTTTHSCISTNQQWLSCQCTAREQKDTLALHHIMVYYLLLTLVLIYRQTATHVSLPRAVPHKLAWQILIANLSAIKAGSSSAPMPAIDATMSEGIDLLINKREFWHRWIYSPLGFGKSESKQVPYDYDKSLQRFLICM